jgi:hypothetical protein
VPNRESDILYRAVCGFKLILGISGKTFMSLAMLGTTEKFQLITLDMLDSHPSIYYSNVICMSQITVRIT